MKSFQKVKPWRSKKYLAFIRKQPCCCCGSEGWDFFKIVAHHEGDGMAEKSTGGKYPDHHAVPLCETCHSARHSRSLDFYATYKVSVPKIWMKLLNKYLTDNGVV